jgi:hypothetical protein
MRRIFYLMSLILLAAGCVTVANDRLAPVLAPAANIGNSVECNSDCKDEWERAQFWLAKHSKWKIQAATNILVQTYNPIQSEPSYGFSVTREPLGGGQYSIRMEMTCGNMFGCFPTPIDVKNAFYYYVKTGNDLLVNQGYLGGIR